MPIKFLYNRKLGLLSTALGLCLSIAFSGPSMAEDKVPALNEAAEKILAEVEKDFEESLKDFGELAGEVYSCKEDKEQREKHFGRVDSIHDELNKLFGTERAFMFAAYFGYGTASENDQPTCTELTDEFEDRYGAISEKYDLID